MKGRNLSRNLTLAESRRYPDFVSTNVNLIIVELPFELDDIIVKAAVALLTNPIEEKGATLLH
jgi:hypothetical protein